MRPVASSEVSTKNRSEFHHDNLTYIAIIYSNKADPQHKVPKYYLRVEYVQFSGRYLRKPLCRAIFSVLAISECVPHSGQSQTELSVQKD